jgi:hypothetical protein
MKTRLLAPLMLLAALCMSGCSGSMPEPEFAQAPPPPPLALPDAPKLGTEVLNPPEVDRSCSVDADCAVKDVGNCCGYFPACVNAQAETFPEHVKAACEAQGLSSICGFEDISACACIEGRCEAAPGGAQVQ